MKNFILLSISLFLSTSVFSQTKRAVVIAIGNYGGPTGKGWKSISSVNDTTFILPALRKQGFEKKNIQLLINEQATIAGLKKGFSDLILATKLNDIVVIHISAHGEQIEDDNKDELDRLDESVVAYGAISPRHSENYAEDIKNYLRDDELGDYIQAIRKAAGPKGDVLVFMDNCHSGSGTRGVSVSDVVRGGENPFVSKEFTKGNLTSDQTISLEAAKEDSNLAPYIVISASRAEEVNTEIKFNGKGYGSLTYAVSKSLENMQPSSTYQGFFNNVQTQMGQLVPKQHPVIEGNGTNRLFWGGKFMKVPSYFIAEVDDEVIVKINGGIIAGISEGSILHLYPVDTYDTTKVKTIAKGIVTSSDNYKAIVKLENELTNLNVPYWAFIKKIKFPIAPIGISFTTDQAFQETPLKKEVIKELQNSLATNDLVDLKAPPSLRLVSRYGKDLLINTKTDYAIDTFNNTLSYTEQLNKAIARYVQSTFIKGYLIQDTNYKVSVRLLPTKNCENTKTCVIDTTLLKDKFINGNYTYCAGDRVMIEATNNSSFRVYINVLDIEPTGKINAILPKKSKSVKPEILFIEPGTTKIFPYPVKINPPYGEEIFKIFVSNKDLDLEQIAASKGDATRDILTDLEKIVKTSYKPSTRGGLGSKEGAVFNVPFTIIPSN